MSSFETNTDDNGNQPSGQPQGTFNQAPPSDQSNSGAGQQVDYAKLQKRLDDSQAFIEQLKRERQQDRQLLEELQKKPTHSLDEIQELIRQERAASTDSAVDPDQLVNSVYERVSQTMTQKEVQQKEQENFNSVAATLAARFGDAIDSKVTEIAKEVGLSLADVIAMSKKNPKAVYKLLGIDAKSQVATSTRSSINTSAMTPPPPPKPKSIMQARTSKERVEVFAQRLEQRLKNQQY